jgi:hypothetical protein
MAIDSIALKGVASLPNPPRASISIFRVAANQAQESFEELQIERQSQRVQAR